MELVYYSHDSEGTKQQNQPDHILSSTLCTITRHHCRCTTSPPKNFSYPDISKLHHMVDYVATRPEGRSNIGESVSQTAGKEAYLVSASKIECICRETIRDKYLSAANHDERDRRSALSVEVTIAQE